MPQMQPIVINPVTTRLTQNNIPPAVGGGINGEQLVSEIHGFYYTANKNGAVFHGSVTGVTVPVIAGAAATVWGLYNPRNSGVDLELLDCDFGIVLATTVVNVYGLYFSADKNADTSTFTTKGTAQSGYIDGGPAGNRGQFYSAVTPVGTPVRWMTVGGHSAVTSTAQGLHHTDFKGKGLIKPGTLVTLYASTAASTTSGIDFVASWAEWPV